MSHDLSRAAVMRIEKGEEMLGGWVSEQIPQVGIYKVLAKKKTDGIIEWAHFVQRDNGLKDRVIRGEAKNHQEFDAVLETIKKTLRRIYGVSLQAADYDIRNPDGKKVTGSKH
ncbi:MAG: hypothetical protein R2940_16390 [Syntrophotaleaceae bacterium]